MDFEPRPVRLDVAIGVGHGKQIVDLLENKYTHFHHMFFICV